MSNKILTLLGLVLLLLPLAFPVNSQAADKVRFAYISDSPGSSAPYWIAKEAGIFKKYGLALLKNSRKADFSTDFIAKTRCKQV